MTTLAFNPPTSAISSVGHPSASPFAKIGCFFANRGIRFKMLTSVLLLSLVAVVGGVMANGALSTTNTRINGLSGVISNISSPLAQTYAYTEKEMELMAFLSALSPASIKEITDAIAQADAVISKNIKALSAQIGTSSAWWNDYVKSFASFVDIREKSSSRRSWPARDLLSVAKCLRARSRRLRPRWRRTWRRGRRPASRTSTSPRLTLLATRATSRPRSSSSLALACWSHRIEPVDRGRYPSSAAQGQDLAGGTLDS